MSLATLAPQTQQALNSLVEKFNNKKDWLISEFTALYKLDASVTPEHVLVGLKGAQNVGTAYAAWYVFKSGISSDLLNISFIHKNYHEIDVKSNSDDMAVELARVSKKVKQEEQRLSDAESANGTALGNALDVVTKSIEKAMKETFKPSQANDLAVMVMMAKATQLRQQYLAVVEATKPATEKVSS